nr:hypothetical protein [Micromonospora sp. DSM 115978]
MTWGTPWQWRSIGGRPRRERERTVWIDTGSGAGLEVAASEAHRFVVPPFLTGTLSGAYRDLDSAPGPDPIPHPIPADVRADALRMTVKRHTANPETGMCACGARLGVETGLCRAARLALDHLMRIEGGPEEDG